MRRTSVKKGRRSLFVAHYQASSGSYRPDMQFWRRFPDEKNLAVSDTIDVNTMDLDTFADENGTDSIDFIELDVEGAELDVLHGARRGLERPGWGLSVEIDCDVPRRKLRDRVEVPDRPCPGVSFLGFYGHSSDMHWKAPATSLTECSRGCPFSQSPTRLWGEGTAEC